MQILKRQTPVRTGPGTARTFLRFLAALAMISNLTDGASAAPDPLILDRISKAPTPIAFDDTKISVPGGGHFQGIQEAWIDAGRFALISGSSSTESYLIVVGLENDPVQADRIIRLLPKPFKHAGGFQVCGDYLAIGLEDNETRTSSRIWIVETRGLPSGNAAPCHVIHRTGPYERATAGAVGFVQDRDRFVLAVGSWDSATIDFYESNGRSPSDSACAFRQIETWDAATADRSDWSDPHYASYQNLNLFTDNTGKLYLLGFARTGDRHHADLFLVRREEKIATVRRLRKLGSRTFDCRQSSFRSGAGLTLANPAAPGIIACGHRHPSIEIFQPKTP